MNETSAMEPAAPPAAETSLLGRVSRGPAIFWLVSLAVQLPLLVMYLTWSWRFEHYQYFPFLLAAVAALTWTRMPPAIGYPVARVPAALFGLSLVVLLTGSILSSPWFGAVSFFLLAASFLFTHGLGYLSVPLLLLVRLPLNYDTVIVTRLQTLTTRLSSYLLDLLQVPHLAQGNVLELADRELFVAEACSGVQSAFTIAFLALLVAAWRRRPLALIPIYLAIALVWAVLCNVVRVTTIAFAAARLQVDLSEGIAHEVLGYSTLLMAALLTLSTDAMLGLVFHSVGGEPEEGFNPFVAAWEWFFGNPQREAVLLPEGFNEPSADSPAWQHLLYGPRRGATIAVFSLGLICMVPLISHAISTPQIINPEGNVLINPSRTMLDDLPGPVTYRFVKAIRGGEDPRLGKNADQWELQFGSSSGLLVFSQPYPEWHDLSICYVGQGWELQTVRMLQPRSGTEHANKMKLARFARRDGTAGYLLYSGLNGDGSVIDPPGDSVLEKTLVRCTQLLTGRGLESIYSGDCAMLQMWIVSDRELDADELSRLSDSMAQVRDRFAAQLANQNRP